MLYFSINIYYSFIYTYEYFSKKKCLNYSTVSNLRKIKLIPNFNIDKKELFFINISMRRFLDGKIKKKDNEITDLTDLYEKKPYNYYMNKIDAQTDGILLFKKKVRIYDYYIFGGYSNIYIYSNIQIEKSNLNEILTKDMKYNNMMIINHSNLICTFDEKGIYIYSYKLENNECIFKIYQTIQFSLNRKQIYSSYSKTFLQEEDGSKFYLLYENAFICISEVNNIYQIDNIFLAEGGKFINFDKFENKMYILEETKIIEINLNNYKTRNFPCPSANSSENFYMINSKLCMFSYRENGPKGERWLFFFDIEKQKEYDELDSPIFYRIEKFGKLFIIVYENYLVFYKFENNKLIKIKSIDKKCDKLGYVLFSDKKIFDVKNNSKIKEEEIKEEEIYEEY